MNKPKIQNVVSTVTLLQEDNSCLDLDFISKQLENAKYDPKKFSALIIRNFEPIRSTALLFSNGRLVCVGTKSSAQALEAVKNFTKQIARVRPTTIKEGTFKIQNIVSSFRFPKALNLPGKLYNFFNIFIKHCTIH